MRACVNSFIAYFIIYSRPRWRTARERVKNACIKKYFLIPPPPLPPSVHDSRVRLRKYNRTQVARENCRMSENTIPIFAVYRINK